jgi:hypothetical protein
MPVGVWRTLAERRRAQVAACPAVRASTFARPEVTAGEPPIEYRGRRGKPATRVRAATTTAADDISVTLCHRTFANVLASGPGVTRTPGDDQNSGPGRQSDDRPVSHACLARTASRPLPPNQVCRLRWSECSVVGVSWCSVPSTLLAGLTLWPAAVGAARGWRCWVWRCSGWPRTARGSWCGSCILAANMSNPRACRSWIGIGASTAGSSCGSRAAVWTAETSCMRER